MIGKTPAIANGNAPDARLAGEEQEMRIDGHVIDADCAVYLQDALHRRPRGLCWCGCGQPAPVATGSNRFWGWIKGQPKRYINGHQQAKAAALHRTHGQSHTPEWKSYWNARDRCTNPKHTEYQNYGARGIKFMFDSFEEFFEVVGPRPSPDLSLDRIDVYKNYEAGNLRWADASTQRINQRPRKSVPRMPELDDELPPY